MTARPMTETAFQAAVVELAHLRGWLVFHVHDSRRGLGAGYPDLTMVHTRTGQLLFAELKSDVGRISQGQYRWMEALNRGGHHVHVWRPADLRDGTIPRLLTPADVGAVTA